TNLPKVAMGFCGPMEFKISLGRSRLAFMMAQSCQRYYGALTALPSELCSSASSTSFPVSMVS
ncbi:MAG: hypothetical protein P8N17_10785, partial [Luminiphilus sp.]|nr:hypothetical protein [Luminiphilus sp.]